MKLPIITVLRKVLEELKVDEKPQPKTDMEDFPIKVSFDIQLSWFKREGERTGMGAVGMYDSTIGKIKVQEIPLDLVRGSPTDLTMREPLDIIEKIVNGIIEGAKGNGERPVKFPYKGKVKMDVVAEFKSKEGHTNSCKNLIITYNFEDQNDVWKVKEYMIERWENDKLEIIKAFQNFAIKLAEEGKELPYTLFLEIKDVPLPALVTTINEKVNEILSQTLP
ncbi:MAG: hypothetical protein QW815_06690 [Nitrososphaerota archaeon]